METLLKELRSYLDQVPITGSNIGEVRRQCLLPWESKWNTLVRDETAAREVLSEKELRPGIDWRRSGDGYLANYPILQYFSYWHLPGHLQVVSRPFYELAAQIVASQDGIPGPHPEVTEGLRELLRAKDCIVRSMLK